MNFYADYVYCPFCKIKLYRITEDLYSGSRIQCDQFESISIYGDRIYPMAAHIIRCGKCEEIVLDPCCGIIYTENGLAPKPIHIETIITRIIDQLRAGVVEEEDISEYLVYPDERVREEARKHWDKLCNQKKK